MGIFLSNPAALRRESLIPVGEIQFYAPLSTRAELNYNEGRYPGRISLIFRLQ